MFLACSFRSPVSELRSLVHRTRNQLLNLGATVPRQLQSPGSKVCLAHSHVLVCMQVLDSKPAHILHALCATGDAYLTQMSKCLSNGCGSCL